MLITNLIYRSLFVSFVGSVFCFSSQLMAQDSFAEMGIDSGAPASEINTPVTLSNQETDKRSNAQAELVAPKKQQSSSAELNGAFAEVVKHETRDFGVSETAQLYAGSMHAPTPTSIPGANLITTPELLRLLESNQGGVAIFDVLGAQQGLPNAIPLVAASQPGHFQDGLQQELGQYLAQLTQGNRYVPMVFYCQGTHCWMSYNAALRAANLGYQSHWYRGGVEAWSMAGQQLHQMGNR